MKDSYGRNIDYMRISVTDKCNLRCAYCMPEDICRLPMADLLTFEEIETVSRLAAELGITRIRLTGGEPLVRRGLPVLVGMLKAVPGIQEVTLTTNGILLTEQLGELTRQGLDGINISLDTLDPEEFAALTGRDELSRVLRGIHAAVSGPVPVKLNTVLRQDLSAATVQALINYAAGQHIPLRFIEMMPIGAGKYHAGFSGEEARELLTSVYGTPVPDSCCHGYGPAVYYLYPRLPVPVGFIRAVHGKFCSSCNRIRLTCTGSVKSCLCYNAGYDLRPSLREGHTEKTKDLLKQAIENKPKEHCFDRPREITETHRMNSIGG